MTRWVAALLLITSCTTGQPLARPSPEPEPSVIPSPHSIWAYDRTLLPPRDARTYENVLLDAKLLSDGGWIVLRAVDPLRYLVDPTFTGRLIKQPYGELLKLDAAGRVVAREHAAEPLELERVDVFEELGVVVGYGRQVRNGTVHALRLDNLDGLASELTNCVAIEGRCWSYRSVAYQGRTALEERDPRTLAVIRTYPHLTMDGLYGTPAIFPSLNLIAWRRPPAPGSVAHGMRAEALDPSRPIPINWLDRLRSACDVVRLADDRAWVEYGPCEGGYADAPFDAGLWHSDLVEVSSGRVLRHFASDEGVWGNELAKGRLVLAPAPYSIDPRMGAPGPLTPASAVALDFDRGIAVIPLTGGGSAALRRRAARSQPQSLPFTARASGHCRDVDFPMVVTGPTEFSCDGFVSRLNAGELLIATGRNYRSPVEFEVTDVTVDPATSEIEIAYRATELAQRPMTDGPVRVIDLSAIPSGEWLVRVVPGRGLVTLSLGAVSTFVVRIL